MNQSRDAAVYPVMHAVKRCGGRSITGVNYKNGSPVFLCTHTHTHTLCTPGRVPAAVASTMLRIIPGDNSSSSSSSSMAACLCEGRPAGGQLHD